MEWMKGNKITSGEEVKAVVSEDGQLVQFALAGEDEGKPDGTLIVRPDDIRSVHQNNDQIARDESVINVLGGEDYPVLATPRQIAAAIDRARYQRSLSE